jgi:hypothetical protein
MYIAPSQRGSAERPLSPCSTCGSSDLRATSLPGLLRCADCGEVKERRFNDFPSTPPVNGFTLGATMANTTRKTTRTASKKMRKPAGRKTTAKRRTTT